MKVLDIRIHTIHEHRWLVAFASVYIDDSLCLTSIGIHRRQEGSGYRLTYPSKTVGGKQKYIFFPLDPKTSKDFEEAIITEYLKNRNAKKCNDWHNHTQYPNK